MAKLISMPTSPNFIRSNFKLVRTIGAVASPYTGKIRTQEFDGVFWTAECTLPPMRRSEAVNWQSFLVSLNGPINHFKFADPDALTNRGTFNANQLKAEARVNVSSATLTFTASTNTIAGASSTTYFNTVLVGDYIVITGSTKPENNGTHKVVTKANAYTITVDPVDYDSLVDHSGASGCTIKVNVKGAKGLCLTSTANSSTGTILKGDYLATSTDTSNDNTGYTPVCYVMASENATETDNGGSAANQYSIRTEPKLRSALTANQRVYFNPAKAKFRLGSKDIDWDADNISNYGISFTCNEVI